MERALLLTGRIETAQGSGESYQLMIDCSYISATYDGSSERIPFYEEVSDTFMKRILEESSPLEVGVFNGLRINPQTGSPERLPRLEESLMNQFSEIVCSKLRQSRIGTIPVPSRN